MKFKCAENVKICLQYLDTWRINITALIASSTSLSLRWLPLTPVYLDWGILVDGMSYGFMGSFREDNSSLAYSVASVNVSDFIVMVHPRGMETSCDRTSVQCPYTWWLCRHCGTYMWTNTKALVVLWFGPTYFADIFWHFENIWTSKVGLHLQWFSSLVRGHPAWRNGEIFTVG